MRFPHHFPWDSIGLCGLCGLCGILLELSNHLQSDLPKRWCDLPTVVLVLQGPDRQFGGF